MQQHAHNPRAHADIHCTEAPPLLTHTTLVMTTEKPPKGAPGRRRAVQRGAGRNEVRHVGDVHAHAQAAARQRLHRQRVVQVLGGGRVNAENPARAGCGLQQWSKMLLQTLRRRSLTRNLRPQQRSAPWRCAGRHSFPCGRRLRSRSGRWLQQQRHFIWPGSCRAHARAPQRAPGIRAGPPRRPMKPQPCQPARQRSRSAARARAHRAERKSRRPASSAAPIVQGTGGRQARTSGPNGTSATPSISSIARVSTSMQPAWPRLVRTVAKGYGWSAGHAASTADTSVRGAAAARSSERASACAPAEGYRAWVCPGAAPRCLVTASAGPLCGTS